MAGHSGKAAHTLIRKVTDSHVSARANYSLVINLRTVSGEERQEKQLAKAWLKEYVMA